MANLKTFKIVFKFNEILRFAHFLVFWPKSEPLDVNANAFFRIHNFQFSASKQNCSGDLLRLFIELAYQINYAALCKLIKLYRVTHVY